MHYVIYLSYKGKLQFYFDVEFQIEFGTLFFLFFVTNKEFEICGMKSKFHESDPPPPQKKHQVFKSIKIEKLSLSTIFIPSRSSEGRN